MFVARARRKLRQLVRSERGVSMLEFALGLPLVLAMGGYGAELSNYALVSQRVNQVALQLADNISRVGSNSASGDLSIYDLREGDINDVLTGLQAVGNTINLTTYGRITISSLENTTQKNYDTLVPIQRIHWQRCIGLKTGADYISHYGTAPTAAGSDDTVANAGPATPLGMGDAGAKVNAPVGSLVIFVEVNYEYQPVFGNTFFQDVFMQKTRIHYTASFLVRDNRDPSQIFNPSPKATAATCNKFTASV